MTFEESLEGNVRIVTITGRLDSANSPGLEKRLTEIVLSNGAPLLVECSGVEYVSSAGLRVFLTVAKKAKSTQVAVALCSIPPLVREIFEISGFLTILNAYPDRAAAVQSFGPTP